jgi:hypothetical protein
MATLGNIAKDLLGRIGTPRVIVFLTGLLAQFLEKEYGIKFEQDFWNNVIDVITVISAIIVAKKSKEGKVL